MTVTKNWLMVTSHLYKQLTYCNILLMLTIGLNSKLINECINNWPPPASVSYNWQPKLKRSVVNSAECQDKAVSFYQNGKKHVSVNFGIEEKLTTDHC